MKAQFVKPVVQFNLVLKGGDYDRIFRKPPRLVWLIMPILFFIAILLFLCLLPRANRLFVPCFAMGIGCAGWSGIALHLRFKNVFAAVFLAFILIIVVALMSGVIEPETAYKDLRSFFSNRISQTR